MPEKPIIERAFELARSGEFKSTAALRKRLKEEGYRQRAIVDQLAGRGIQTELRALLPPSSGRQTTGELFEDRTRPAGDDDV